MKFGFGPVRGPVMYYRGYYQRVLQAPLPVQPAILASRLRNPRLDRRRDSIDAWRMDSGHRIASGYST